MKNKSCNLIFKVLCTCLCTVFFCSCSQDENNLDSSRPKEITSAAFSSETAISAVHDSETVLTTNKQVTSVKNTNTKERNISDFLNKFDWSFSYALFCDIDLDENIELLIVRCDDRSFSTDICYIYKLNKETPELYGRIDLESDKSDYSVHTVCEGKLQRYFDSEKGVYVIISDATKWDDGSFGNVQYSVIENTLYSDKIINKTLEKFSGTPCIPAQHIRDNTVTDYSYIDEWNYVYCNGVFDLNGTEKFIDISDAAQKLKFIDTIDLSSLPKYQDDNEIAELISEYSGYENTNKVSAPDEENDYIGIVGMGNQKIQKSDTEVHIELKDDPESEWSKILEIEDLHSLVLHYYGDEPLEIDLSSLKKYPNLASISLPENISENTKQLISELITLEYVNKWSIMISNEKDFEYIKNLPDLNYIAVESDNDDPDYFKFLYTNQNIEWIRFAESVTAEQIKQTVDNMPNLKAVTFGFSEV